MRRFLLVIALCAFFFCQAGPARAAEAAAVVLVTAQQIALHADRGLLIADGGVSIRIGAQAPITATRASYDLRANRITAIGDDAASGYVYDFASKTSSSPKSAAVPQLGTFDALAIGQQVELHPAISITFSNAQVLAGSTFVPAASYTYLIPPADAKDFGYSPVPAAALDYGTLIGSSRDYYAFTRGRYDRYNGGFGAGLEEHYARTDRGYAAAGETLDASGARYDLVSYLRVNGAVSESLTGSLLAGTRTARYALTSSGPHGYTSFSITQFNSFRSDDLLVSGNQHAIGSFASMRLQIDAAHDVHPFDWSGAQDYRLTPGVHMNTAALHLGSSSVSASTDLGEALYNYGRATLASSATVWGNFPATYRVQFSGGATFSHNAPPFPSTFRTYTMGMTWKASDAFNLVSSLNYAHDDDQTFGFGRPQFSAAFDVRVRRRNHTGIETGIVVPFGGVGNMNRQGVFNLRFFKW
jgi:hypothetical protein